MQQTPPPSKMHITWLICHCPISGSVNLAPCKFEKSVFRRVVGNEITMQTYKELIKGYAYMTTICPNVANK